MNYSETIRGDGAAAFVISRSWAGQYVWRLMDEDGRVLETSTSRYGSHAACIEAIERIKRVAPDAVIREHAVIAS